jgi:phosphoglycolate phosphatase-like HAD superfamily hydrolase
MLKAVIFDIDGTLIDSVDLHARSWVDAFARFGLEVKFEELRPHIGEGADRLIPAFAPPGMPDDERKKIEKFRSELFKRSYLDKVKPFPKVKELFERIQADGCKLVLASSCAADEINQYKAIAGVTDMTDHDVTADDAGSSKPSPDIFLEALDRLAPISPSQACVVGDTKYDGEAARRAGVPFIGLLCGGSSKDELKRSGALAIFSDPTELLNNWSCWRELSVKRAFSAAS